MTRSNTLRRVLLLFMLAFGVAGMHTFGHDGITSFAATAGTAAMTDEHGTSVRAIDSGQLAHGGTVPQHPGTPHEPTGPLDVCLAILGFAIILAMAAFGIRRAARPAIWHTIAEVVRGSGRSPPPALAGLQLAILSVLRI